MKSEIVNAVGTKPFVLTTCDPISEREYLANTQPVKLTRNINEAFVFSPKINRGEAIWAATVELGSRLFVDADCEVDADGRAVTAEEM